MTVADGYQPVIQAAGNARCQLGETKSKCLQNKETGEGDEEGDREGGGERKETGRREERGRRQGGGRREEGDRVRIQCINKVTSTCGSC